MEPLSRVARGLLSNKRHGPLIYRYSVHFCLIMKKQLDALNLEVNEHA